MHDDGSSAAAAKPIAAASAATWQRARGAPGMQLPFEHSTGDAPIVPCRVPVSFSPMLRQGCSRAAADEDSLHCVFYASRM